MSLATSLVGGYAEAAAITGKVVFEGKAPVMKPLTLTADPACAAMHPDKPVLNEALVLGEGQTMANILVSVTKGLPEEAHPVPTEPFVLTQKGCTYAPHVFAVRTGQTLKILNPDGVLHNVHSMPNVNTPMNKAMPKDLLEIETVFEKPEAPFVFKCDIHPWMQAWCAVLDHPFFSVTGTNGQFTITGLEPGEYEVTAWHERLGTRTLTVTVAEADVTADFSFAR
jgi:plastocyanin